MSDENNIEEYWHPQEAEHIANGGMKHDFYEVWKFPCCGKIVYSDPQPSQYHEGCEKKPTNQQEKYIQQTYELDKERQLLVAELNTDISDARQNEISTRLDTIYHALASNAVILADFLRENIG